NVMFIARLDSELPISKEVNDLLNDDVKAGIRSGKYFYIPQHNTWARNQYVVFLVAPTKNDMIQSLYDKGELVSEDFRKSYYKRLKERMFKRFENEELEQYLAKHYPFTLRLPPDYLLLDESQEERYIWLRRLHPDRSLAVHWIPYNDTIDITYDWIVKQRNKLAEKIFHGDVVVEEESKLRELKFKRWQAKRLVGTWKNPELVIGGPFRSTVFVDKKTNYIFMIDFYVRAIGQRKRPYIDQLDVIAHTFRLATDKEEKTSL
ncbi:DUF4837 family protein, partial [Candidatus Saccharibacteria bacterium]|nr:DUF4837 family protein [Candidatus Saccharibacteria bacterium]NIW79903.1 DUF4837 family protein [Calditrichia bacterium]